MLDRHLASSAKIKCHVGGTRSSKTHSLCQALIVEAHRRKRTIDVVRKTLPALRATALTDFIEILRDYNLYDDDAYHKQDHIFKIGPSEVRFYSVDESQKLRGRSRDIVWLNEANELSYDDWRQLAMRTREEFWLDFNPSDEHHWIYDFVLSRSDCEQIHSTYLDNPFLPIEQVKEIELLREEDEEYWKIFGQGLRGTAKATIYSNWHVAEFNRPDRFETIFGLDFGFNNPSALVEVTFYENRFWVSERLFETRLTNQELLDRVKPIVGDYELYCDSAEPARIEEFNHAGIRAMPADKSVEDGIDYVKRCNITVDPNSVNLIKEFKEYRWKADKTGKFLDEPVKFRDHCLDAMRYAIYTHRAGLDSWRPPGRGYY